MMPSAGATTRSLASAAEAPKRFKSSPGWKRRLESLRQLGQSCPIVFQEYQPSIFGSIACKYAVVVASMGPTRFRSVLGRTGQVNPVEIGRASCRERV